MDSSRIPESLSADLKKAWIPSRRREITDLFRLVVASFNGVFCGGCRSNDRMNLKFPVAGTILIS